MASELICKHLWFQNIMNPRIMNDATSMNAVHLQCTVYFCCIFDPVAGWHTAGRISHDDPTFIEVIRHFDYSWNLEKFQTKYTMGQINFDQHFNEMDNEFQIKLEKLIRTLLV